MPHRLNQHLDSNAQRPDGENVPIISTNPIPRDPCSHETQAIPEWITPELLERTRELWERKSGAPVTTQDALAILLRVGALLDILTRK